jgi:tetratricopeptide (TPR) repeat protein
MIGTVIRKNFLPFIILYGGLASLLLGMFIACTTSTANPAPSLPAGTGAVRLYTRTPTPLPTPTLTTPTLAPGALYRQGLTRREDWDLAGALEYFDAALAQDSELAAAYASRAEVYRLTGHYEAATADLERALSLDGELAEAWWQKALLEYNEEAWDQALDAVNQLIKLRPRNGAAYLLRAQIYTYGLDKPTLALTNYKLAVMCNPSLDKTAQAERWHALAARGRWEDARDIAYQMFNTGSNDPLRYYYLGWSLVQLGQPDQAIQTALLGIRRYPDYPAALYYALGMAYYERSAWPEAIQVLEVALAQTSALTDGPAVDAAWGRLDINTTDILSQMGLAYLQLGQCETGAAIVERAASEAPAKWGQARERIDDCYTALTPTPTFDPTALP